MARHPAFLLGILAFAGCDCGRDGIVLYTLDRDSGQDAGQIRPDARGELDAGPGLDGGPEGGADGGPDGGSDAGRDAGTDSGTDAGPVDAGPCEYHPGGPLEIAEEWSWLGDTDVLYDHRQVMMSPTVADLNGDGVPDIVFNTFSGITYRWNGITRAISGDDGRRLWPTADPPYRVDPAAEIAIGEVDASSPGPEIFTCSETVLAGSRPGHLLELAADGTLLRRFDTAPNLVPCGEDAPAIGDMDGDGIPEIVVRYVIAHADGTVLQTIRDLSTDTGTRYAVLADVDEDPDLELIGGNGVYDHDGTPLWERLVDSPGRPAIPSSHVGVADLDRDGLPEQVVVSAGVHQLRVIDPRTGDDIMGPVDVNPPEVAMEVARDSQMGRGGGPPMMANLDDDPELEIGVSGGWGYSVFDSDLTRLWWVRINDLSSRQTGSSAFDFEGDGRAEPLVKDEYRFRVLDGREGTVLGDVCNGSGTLAELAVPVDVDADGDAEVVVSQNDYSRPCPEGGAGIRVFGGPRHEWVATRRIWNQHTYMVTNVNDDATIPARQVMPWRVPGLNAFRANILLDRFEAPDLIVAGVGIDDTGCPSLRLAATVANRGTARAFAGVPVVLYEGTGGARHVVGRAATTRTLDPGESEVVVFDVTVTPPGPYSFTVQVNDAEGSREGTIAECRTANNSAGPFTASCGS